MPKPVNIEIFRISQTKVNPLEVDRWMKHLGADTFASDLWDKVGQAEVSDPALVIALAAKRCYMSFEPGLNKNVTQVRSDYVKYFDNILASGHGSVLEHATFSYALEGVSRVFTAEMNRHRAGWAISEGSLRFIRFDKEIPYWIPTSLQGEDVMSVAEACLTIHEIMALDHKKTFPENDEGLETRKQLSRQIFKLAFQGQEDYYRALLKIWDMEEGDHNFSYKKKVTSCLRRIVGLGVATGGVWTGNVRALRHVFAMRASAAAEEEMLHVFSRIAKDMRDSQPLLFGDFEERDGFWDPKYAKV